jgi:hypothetical protein
VLVSDEGLAALVDEARRDGRLPADLVMTASAMLGIAVGAKLLADVGDDPLNIASDVGLVELAAFRALTPPAIDIYVDGPDNLGGFCVTTTSASWFGWRRRSISSLGLRTRPASIRADNTSQRRCCRRRRNGCAAQRSALSIWRVSGRRPCPRRAAIAAARLASSRAVSRRA